MNCTICSRPWLDHMFLLRYRSGRTWTNTIVQCTKINQSFKSLLIKEGFFVEKGQFSIFIDHRGRYSETCEPVQPHHHRLLRSRRFRNGGLGNDISSWHILIFLLVRNVPVRGVRNGFYIRTINFVN